MHRPGIMCRIAASMAPCTPCVHSAKFCFRDDYLAAKIILLRRLGLAVDHGARAVDLDGRQGAAVGALSQVDHIAGAELDPHIHGEILPTSNNACGLQRQPSCIQRSALTGRIEQLSQARRRPPSAHKDGTLYAVAKRLAAFGALEIA